MMIYFSRINDSKILVGQFPFLTKITFGGNSNLKLKFSKSSSLVMI